MKRILAEKRSWQKRKVCSNGKHPGFFFGFLFFPNSPGFRNRFIKRGLNPGFFFGVNWCWRLASQPEKRHQPWIAAMDWPASSSSLFEPQQKGKGTPWEKNLPLSQFFLSSRRPEKTNRKNYDVVKKFHIPALCWEKRVRKHAGRPSK